jgi:hypothetical protein
MEYMVVIVAALVITVGYLYWKVRFLFNRILGLTDIVTEQYAAERKILTEIKKAMED